MALISRDGNGIVFGTLSVFFATVVLWQLIRHPFFLYVAVILGVFSLFNFYFFRDPERHIPDNPRAVLSPADGKVLEVVEEFEPEYFQKNSQRISIFLSVLDVHVNRSPIGGRVDYFRYNPGKFLVAYAPKASRENEHTAIGISNERGYRVFFKQIAGLIARRIVCHLREGHLVRAGERIGMIRYGSRVDVFVPTEARVLVKRGQRVRAGESILATFLENGKENIFEETVQEEPVADLVLE